MLIIFGCGRNYYFSLICAYETNKNQPKTLGGEEVTPAMVWPGAQPQLGFGRTPGTSRHRPGEAGAEPGSSAGPGPVAQQAGVRSLTATISSTPLVLLLGHLPFLALVAQNMLICHIALDKFLLAFSCTATREEKVINTSILQLDNKTFLWASHMSTNLILMVFQKYIFSLILTKEKRSLHYIWMNVRYNSTLKPVYQSVQVFFFSAHLSDRTNNLYTKSSNNNE